MTQSGGLPAIGDIRLVAFDVDGVFTDGCFRLSDDGIESKSFNTQDGFGIRQLLRANIEVAVISGRGSRAVEIRMRELGVRHVFLGSQNKVADLDSLCESLGLTRSQCAYVGDDLPDMPLLGKVGLPIAVANAVSGVKNACSYITHATGGAGAVREVCEMILHPDESSAGES